LEKDTDTPEKRGKTKKGVREGLPKKTSKKWGFTKGGRRTKGKYKQACWRKRGQGREPKYARTSNGRDKKKKWRGGEER